MACSTNLSSQSVITLEECNVTYVDPQDQNNNTESSRDTLVYTTQFERDSFLRAFYVDINAFGGQQVDRTKVSATFEDGTTKLLGELAFGSCLSCVQGFAFVHEGSLLTSGEQDRNVMQLWFESFSQPDFSIIGNLQTLNGVGRISGEIPFCAVGLRVEFIVNSNPNNATTEFSAHIVCPPIIRNCFIDKVLTTDCANNRFSLEAVIPEDCFSTTASVQWQKSGVTVGVGSILEDELFGNEGWYHLIVEDDCCLLVDSILIENAPFANAGPDQTACVEDTIRLVGSGGMNHFWEELGGGKFQDSIFIFQGLTSGSYVLHAFDEDNCEDTDTLNIQINPLPSVVPTFTSVCIGDTLVLRVEDSGQFDQISWVNPNGELIGPTILDFQRSDFGLYSVGVQDTFGCENSARIEVTGKELPEIAFMISEGCDSTRVELSPQQFEYFWPGGSIGNRFATQNGGNYEVTITDQEGCSSIEAILLPEPEGPEIELAIEQPLCPDDNGSIKILPKNLDIPMIFSIDGGQTYSFETQYFGLGPGNYEIVVQDDLECIQTFDVELIRPDTLWVNIDVDTNTLVVRPGTPVNLSASTYGQIEEIQWLPIDINTEQLNTSFIAEDNLDIRIIVKDANGCFVSDGFQLDVELGDVYAPNAFSPNQDGNNEYFTLYSDLGSGEIIELLQVYDRYGNLLFSTSEVDLNQPQLGWNGSYKGEIMATGVYTFFGVVRFGNGVRKIYEGDIAIIR